jgi:hypothetical protein
MAAGVRIETGQHDPVRGWVALQTIQPAHDITYTARTDLPVTLPVVLWPLRPGQQALPHVSLLTTEPAGSEAAALVVRSVATTDLFIIATQPTAMQWSDGVFHGQALWIRHNANDTLQYIVAVRATYLELKQRVIIDQLTDVFEQTMP